MEYCRNGIRELAGIIGRERTLEIGQRAARLTGLQQYKHMADAMGCIDGDVADAARFLGAAFEGMGDAVHAFRQCRSAHRDSSSGRIAHCTGHERRRPG